MTSYGQLSPYPLGCSGLAADRLRLAVAAYLARFTGISREPTASDLRCYLTWCADHGLDPVAARRPDLELYIRWMQEVRRFKPATVSRGFSGTRWDAETAALGLILVFAGPGKPLGDLTEFPVWLFRAGIGLLALAIATAGAAIFPQLNRREARRNWQSNYAYFGHLRHWNPGDLVQSLQRNGKSDSNLARRGCGLTPGRRPRIARHAGHPVPGVRHHRQLRR